MEFKCNAAPNSVPCIHIALTDDQGRTLAKPKKTFKVVRNGESVFSWINRTARKHFTAMDAEAKELNARDYKEMLAEMNEILAPHGESVTKGTPFSVLADSLAKIAFDNRKEKVAEKPALITIPSVKPALPEPALAPVVAEEVEVVELTNAQLKAKIEDLGGEYPAVVNKAQLKDILSKLEADKEE